MASTTYLIRHAESEHNVSKDFSQLDPPLTALGRQQAAQLVNTFPHPERIAVVITSPLRRAIQTALAGFSHVLDKRYYENGSGGVENGVRLILDPDLQERSALPCDTGSENQILEKEFGNLDLGKLTEDWRSKSGLYAEDDEAVGERAKKARESLVQICASLEGEGAEKRDIVVVTHGVFMKFLAGDPDIDLPKAGWRSYTLHDVEGVGAHLAPTA
jgi:broad specificity phosphatase PhoE